MELTDCRWTEHTGRNIEDDPFHAWAYQHVSGRILAEVGGPSDTRGGFTHQAQFLFHGQVANSGGPFVFIDFDSAKRFVESVLASRIEAISIGGELKIIEETNPSVVALQDALKTMQAMAPAFAPKP